MRVEWGKRQCLDWWRAALRYPVAERAGCFVCHPVSHLAWTSSAGLPPPPQWMAQLDGSYLPRESPPLKTPSLLSFPGAAAINSATRTMALQVDWDRVRSLTAELEFELEKETGSLRDGLSIASMSRTVDATFDPLEGHWQVELSSLDLVIAHAMLDLPVVVRPAPSPEPQSPEPTIGRAATLTRGLDETKLFPIFKRAGELERVRAASISIQDGWQTNPTAAGGTGRPLRLLDPALVMSSRDLEALVWPKVWHFAKKLRTIYGDVKEGESDYADSHQAAAHVFGTVPVTWVPLARRWMSGNRHRGMASRLAGLPVAAAPTSKSEDPWAD